jgi:acylphosphatase
MRESLPMTEPATTERRVVYYAGRVQGVGFRYTAVTLAKQFQVTGTVENLSDGRVLLIVEGEKREIEDFCGEIDRQLGGNIAERKVDRRPMTGQFTQFEVKY